MSDDIMGTSFRPEGSLHENDQPPNRDDQISHSATNENNIPDDAKPVNWSKSRKWILTSFACFMCFAIGINALSISSASVSINKQFHISDQSFPNSYWTVTTWNLGAAIAPVIGLPLMESFGVRNVYLVS